MRGAANFRRPGRRCRPRGPAFRYTRFPDSKPGLGRGEGVRVIAKTNREGPVRVAHGAADAASGPEGRNPRFFAGPRARSAYTGAGVYA